MFLLKLENCVLKTLNKGVKNDHALQQLRNSHSKSHSDFYYINYSQAIFIIYLSFLNHHIYNYIESAMAT